MENTNYIGRSLLTILLAAVFIVIYPVIYDYLPFLHGSLRTYALLPNNTQSEVDSLQWTAQMVDTVPTDTVSVQLIDHKTVEESTPAPVVKPNISLPPSKKGPSYSGVEYMSRFFSSLYQTKETGRKLRIAYFGDSMIEGDLVTGTLREDLQASYGGQGVGFVPIASIAPGFRKTIKHSFSKDWIRHTILNSKPPKFPFGIAGDYSYVPVSESESVSDSWVKYEGSPEFERTRTFSSVKLYYGTPQEDRIQPKDVNQVSIVSAKGMDTLKLTSNRLVNEITLPQEGIDALELRFSTQTSLPIYGLSFEHGEGVYVDNFSVRGNSGLGLMSIDPAIWQQFNKHMNYDLIVLHYGVNVIDTDRKSYGWYQRKLGDLIKHIQDKVPNTDILVVSVSDKSTRINGKLQTDPSVPKIVYAQRKAAENTEVAFLNLYSKMGGKNSMVRWVDKKWANKDYTHVNRVGARVVSNIIKKYLMTGFESYEALVQGQMANK